MHSKKISRHRESVLSVELRIILLLFLTLMSCGPIKGYEGPDLPREQLGLVKLGTAKCDKCRVDSVQAGSSAFFSRGVLLLPGKYYLQSKVVSWGEPYDCHTESYFDNAVYSTCESARREAQKRERSFYRNCSAEASRTQTVCSRNFNESSCSGGFEISSNENWEVVAQSTGSEDPINPGQVSMAIKPFFSAEKLKELTKLHTLEKPTIPDEQSISYCRVTNSGVW